jgi:hypothetical protein
MEEVEAAAARSRAAANAKQIHQLILTMLYLYWQSLAI